jgi:chromosome segregation ATPase
MACRSGLTSIGLLVGIMLLAATSARDAAAVNPAQRNAQTAKKTGLDQIQKDVTSLQDQVNKAQAELDAAKKEMDPLQKDIDTAEAAVRDAARKLAEAGTKIEDEQPSDSAFAKAKASFLANKKTYEDAQSEVKNSVDYQTAYAAAKDSPDRLTLIPALKKEWFDDNATIQDAKTGLTATKETYESLRDGILHKNDDWRQASDALTAAKKAHDEATQKAQSAIQRLKTAKTNLAKLTGELAAAKSRLAAAQGAANQPMQQRRRR